jgi:hypothetical protein
MAIAQGNILVTWEGSEARSVEHITYCTLKVSRDNRFLLAGLRAMEEYFERDRQTKKRGNREASTNSDNQGSLANYVALEWMTLWRSQLNYGARNQMNDILRHITSPREMKSIFLVAHIKLTKNKDQGIIQIRMNSNYSRLEEQLINEIVMCDTHYSNV